MKIGDQVEWVTDRRSKVDRSTEWGKVIAHDAHAVTIITYEGRILTIAREGTEFVPNKGGWR